jgi:hypothetical protein
VSLRPAGLHREIPPQKEKEEKRKEIKKYYLVNTKTKLN